MSPLSPLRTFGRYRALLAAGVVLLAAIVVGSITVGAAGSLGVGDALRGLGALVGLGAGVEDPQRALIADLRIWRALTAAGVGAALGLSGGLIQGLFRNPLASPSLLGVSGGASLGAAIAIAWLGGFGLQSSGFSAGALFVPLASFVGALATVTTVALLASRDGRTSVGALLLIGIAVNMCVAGGFAAIQSLTLRDFEVSRAILAWTFGTLEDRSPHHAAIVWGAVVACAATIPFLARELDLFRGGEADAESLGVSVGRVKTLALVAAALSASAAVAVAGQIAFVGLVVPHFVRLFAGPGHGRVLPACVVFGAILLLGADLAQRALFGAATLQPGVLMSLAGGPFFVLLLVRHRKEIGAW